MDGGTSPEYFGYNLVFTYATSDELLGPVVKSLSLIYRSSTACSVTSSTLQPSGRQRETNEDLRNVRQYINMSDAQIESSICYLCA
jgi:hypothetical protein